MRVDLLFLDASGTTVADSGPLTLTAGQATSLTMSGASLTYAPGALRAQVEARVQLLSSPGHALAFATLELLDPDSTVLVLYPSGPVRALATTTLTFGPLALSSGDSIGIAVANLSSVSDPKDSVKAVLSFFSLEGTLLKQEEVTVAPEHTATLSMSGAAFSGEVIGQVRFDPSTALTVSSLQLFDTTTQTTKVDLYPTGPLFPSGPVFPSSP